MEKLKKLIDCFSSSELQLIKNYYLRKFGTDPTPKRLLLLELIEEGKICSNIDAAKLLYKQPPNSTFSKLKERLREDLLNFLLIFPFQKFSVSILQQNELICRKLVLQGKVLIAKGITEEGLIVLKKALKIAEKFDLPGIKLTINETMRMYEQSIYLAQSDMDYLRHLYETLRDYEKILLAKEINRNFKNNVYQPKVFDFTTSSKEFWHNLNQPGENSQAVKSKRVYFWSKLTALSQHLYQKRYEKALECGQGLIDLIEQHPILCTQPIKTGIYLNLGRTMLYMKNYMMAKEYGETSLSVSNPHSTEEIKALKLLFFSYLRAGSFQKALGIIEKALKIPLINTNEVFLKEWKLFASAIDFSMNNYKQAIQKLANQKGGIIPNNTFLLGAKLLELMSILEVEDYDWFEYKLQTFRKKLYQFRGEEIGRYEVILKIFIDLASNGFDYKHLWDKQTHRLTLLFQEEGEFSWDILGSEIIPFHLWMKQKATNTKNDFIKT